VYAEYIILQTGTTTLRKIFYRPEDDVMVHLGPKIEALRDEYVRFAVEKCSSVLKEYCSATETIAGILLERDEITADEIWHIFRKAPRIPQPQVKPVDEYGALVYVGRWGIYGVSLPGRVTFSPRNVGYATYGAPRPQQTKVISADTEDTDAPCNGDFVQLTYPELPPLTSVLVGYAMYQQKMKTALIFNTCRILA